MKALLAKIRAILQDRKARRFWARVISVMASVVVFISTYALILPAITMETVAACGIEAHQHTDDCYEDILVCGQEESEDHQHTEACYEHVLTCGKEAHIHSAECYKEDSTAVAATGGTSVPVIQEDAQSGSPETSGRDAGSAEAVDEGNEDAAGAGRLSDSDSDSQEPDGSADTSGTWDTSALTVNENASDATTKVLPEDLAEEELAGGYVPALEALNFDALLTKETGFYYFHPEEGQPVPENSSDISDWKELKKDTTLASTDLVKAYLAYTIPAGALNETNQIARYRLPANIHLTDDQILAINSTENGIAASYVIPGTETTDDPDSYRKYLGAEAVEGTRTPDKTLREGAMEYVSAVVKAENVYENTLDENGSYVDAAGHIAADQGDYIGQDLIFIFTPYTIQKNQNTYDNNGDPIRAGQKVTGWFAVDFNMDQIDWIEQDTDTDLDNSTVEKSAEVVFAQEDAEAGTKERIETLRLEEQRSALTEDEYADEGVEDENTGDSELDEKTEALDESGAADTVEHEEEDENKALEDRAEEETDAEAEIDIKNEEEGKDKKDKDDSAEEEEVFKDGTLTADGDGYHITMDYTAEAQIPDKASLSVKEITPDTDPEAYAACLQQAAEKMGAGLDDGEDSIADNADPAISSGEGSAGKAGTPTLDTAASRFFDIEIVVTDEEGNREKIEPKAPVAVNIQLNSVEKDAAAAEKDKSASGQGSSPNSAQDQKADPTVLHFAEEGVEKIDSTVDAPASGTVSEKNTEDTTAVSFEAESFSIYGVVYTVDFHWEVDGNVYEYSLAGGDSVSFRELVEALHVIDGEGESAGDSKAAAPGYGIDEFVKDVADVRFSDESLVKVIHVTEGITAGGLKEKYDLACEYSAELTESQREAMDSKVFYPADWALVSLKAFNTEEYLTVDLLTGESFTVKVTDAQIQKDYINEKGETWEITVTYDDAAEIPDGADLAVEELLPGTSAYNHYLNSSADELRAEADDISFARFFDISIVDKDGIRIEPKAPVTVQIKYKDAIEIGKTENLSVIHFADKGTEIIDNINLNEACTTVTYAQDSFSVTGTVVSGSPRNGNAYMLIVDYEGEKYIINNDGTLIPVTKLNETQIDTNYPMLWTYNYQYGGNFRIASEATGFDASNVAVGFYYRYIDPNVDSGLTEEDAQHPNLAGSTQVNYNNNLISSARNSNLYISVSDEGGTLHIVGNQNGASKAARITLYSPGNVNSADPANHSVNHIDISIRGDANVDVPLAYGIYYYKEGNIWHKLIVGANVPDVTGDGVAAENTQRVENHTENLKAENISVTSADMKGATIVATRHDTHEVVQDAFYITGYSANHSTEYSTYQVRIEGSFKVADMTPVSNWWEVNSANTRNSRLHNIIDYTVTADKKLNMPLTYTVDGKTYELYKDPTDDAEQVSVVATVKLGATFNYWDHDHKYNDNDGNECPPLQPGWGYDAEWKNGGIQPWGISGMDFVLHGKGTAEAKVLALEIVKTLKFLDEDGNVEEVQYNQPLTMDYEVYTDRPGDPGTVRVPGGEVHDYSSYKDLHGVQISVKQTTDGKNSGHVYDYDVTDGMYYVREVRDDNFPTKLTIGSDTYRYVSTNIKTEYSHRHNQYRDRETGYHQMHEVNIASDTADLNSIPEVLGQYTADDGQEENNEFLEFYFENVYQKNATPPPPEPITETMEINLDKKWQDGDDTTAPTEGSVTFYLRRKVVQNGSETEDTSFNNQNNKYVVSAVDGWKLTIPNLVWHETDTQGTFDRTYKYYFEEDTAQAVGADVQRYGVPSFTNGYGSVNSPVEGGNEAETVTVECTNKTGNVLRIQKRWLNVDPDVAPAVTLRIWRQQVEVNQWGANAHGSREAYNYNGTNNIIVLDNTSRVPGTNWWQLEIPLPTEKGDQYYKWNGTENVLTNYEYAYYISEDSLNNGSDDYLAPQFYKLLGDEVVDDYVAWGLTNPNTGNAQGMGFDYRDWGNHQSHPETYVTTAEGKDGTLIVMNAPKTAFHHVVFEKEWYKYNQNGQLVKADSNDTRNYAVGIQIYQRVKSLGNNGEWHAFAKPIYLGAPGGIIDSNGHNYIMDENNPFVFEGGVSDNNGAWKWQLIDNASKTGFPTYAVVDGQKVYYEYEAREIGVYTTIDGVNKASAADQLQRVFDYSNTQEWSFDYQNKQPKGINVEAGKLKVTKNWQGGHEGSRIYFKLFRDGSDITNDIISDPESYGLNEFQVYDDGTHKALFVAYNGTSWDQNYVIQGLPIGPSSGGSLYKYSIQEIGYSEADGTNCWDNETITNSDGSIRKDPHGQTITVDIDADLLVGYKVDNGTVSQSDGKSGEAVLTELPNNAPHNIEVYNTYVEKYKDFEFTKVWENGAGEFQTWPADIKSIKVDLYAKAGTGESVKIAEGIDFYVTPPTQDSRQEFTWNGVTYKWGVNIDPSGTIYTFKIPDLPAKDVYPNGNDYEYSVVEQSVNNYETRYGSISDIQKTVEGTSETVTVKAFVAEEATSAANGKVISNKNNEPQTGALKITKAVTVNGEVPTDANKAKTNGTFEFTVAGIAETDTADVTHKVKITFADGKATSYQIDTNAAQTVSGTDNTWAVVLGNLTPGEYTITETAPTIEGMSLKTVTGSKVNATTNVATVTVTAGDTEAAQTAAQVTFTNNYTEYEVVIVKVDTGNTTTKLGGAEFDLYTASSVEEKDGKIIPKSDATPVNGSNKLISSSTEGDGKGKVSLGTLAAGTYYLFETKAPAGYVPMDMPVTITVSDGRVTLVQGSREETKTVSDNTLINAKAEITVMNSTGVELPHTGGPGTRHFYILGALMTALAGVWYVMRRRRV